MSCGNPHATPCTEVLAMVDVFVDGEADEVHVVAISTHLVECPPCARQVAVVRDFKAVIRRANTTAAPAGLRTQIRARLQQTTIVYGQAFVQGQALPDERTPDA